MGQWTKLTAVNRILRGGGENPVSSLASTSGDALMAEAILDEVNLECQLSGLACNTEEVEVAPDVNGNVAIAANALHVEAFNIPGKFVTVRGVPPLLYNVTDGTNVFTESSIKMKIVSGLSYDELPFAQQVAIADEAAQRYQMLVVGDGGMNQVLMGIWQQSRARARAQDVRERRPNVFKNFASRLPYWGAKRTQRADWWR